MFKLLNELHETKETRYVFSNSLSSFTTCINRVFQNSNRISKKFLLIKNCIDFLLITEILIVFSNSLITYPYEG